MCILPQVFLLPSRGLKILKFSLMAQISKTTRGKDKLIFRGYGYTLGTTNLTTQNWRCERNRQDRCRGSASTPAQYVDGSDVVEKGEHNHPPDPSRQAVNVAIEGALQTAVTTQHPPRRILSEMFRPLDDEGVSRVPKRKALIARIRRKRARLEEGYEALPRDRTFMIPERFRVVTCGGEEVQFLQHDDRQDDGVEDEEEDEEEEDNDRILIFGTPEGLDMVAGSNTIMLDGTFKVCPSLFFQLFTIHAVRDGWVFPCVFALLPRKDQATYIRMFNIIRGLRPEFRPERAICDYETGVHAALRNVFQNISVEGCFFHLSQSIWRRVQSAGLAQAYVQNPAVRKYVKSLGSLAFLPVEQVVRAFEALQEEIDEMEDLPAALVEVYESFEDTYIGRQRGRGRRLQPRFIPQTWNVRQRTTEGLPRTTNKLEGWHLGIQSMFDGPHPSVWKFLGGLQREQVLATADIQMWRIGQEPPQQERRYRQVNERLTALIRAHENGERSTQEFITAVGYHLSLNV